MAIATAPFDSGVAEVFMQMCSAIRPQNQSDRRGGRSESPRPRESEQA